MPTRHSYDAVVVGSGPNGLAAAIELSRHGRSVVIYEGAETVGGGARSASLTEPGFVHDVCAAVMPLAAGSPFFRSLPLDRHGLEWVYPPVAAAHPFDDGSAAALHRSLDKTVATLGDDGDAYLHLMSPLVSHWEPLLREILGPLRIPHHPLLLAKFGVHAIQSAEMLSKREFATDHARAFFAGLAAHAIMPLRKVATAAFGMVLAGSGHAVGWPFAKGGTQRLADALAAHFRSLGGEIVTECRVTSLASLPPARALLFDVTPRQLLSITSSRLSTVYRRQLARYRYGPGVCKVDWALDRPIPWTADACRQAGTVHVAGGYDEIAASEDAIWRGAATERPYTIVTQPTLFDSSRAPDGKHIAWAYCHVPHNSSADMTDFIERQVERFAPGFRGTVLARSVMSATDMESYNPNYVGGDINGGVQDLRQLFTRPALKLNPYSTSDPEIFLCSSSTPPGGGVHGMCGYYAAQSALGGPLA